MATRDTRQVNIRIDRRVFEVLETVRYLRDLRGMQEVLEPVVSEFAADVSEDTLVQTALDARRESLSATASPTGNLKQGGPKRELTAVDGRLALP